MPSDQAKTMDSAYLLAIKLAFKDCWFCIDASAGLYNTGMKRWTHYA